MLLQFVIGYLSFYPHSSLFPIYIYIYLKVDYENSQANADFTTPLDPIIIM